MFTGIIEEVGRLKEIEAFGGGRKLAIQCSFASELKVDQSVAVNGACQTVVAVHKDSFEVVAIEETLRKTTFGEFEAGIPLNLERAMPMNGRLDGHFVLGHVDATGTVTSVTHEETNWLIEVSFDHVYEPYIIPVGSITIDGISLTVARLEANTLTVAIIPHTFEHTNVSGWKAGSKVNLEFDMIGKYVVRWLDKTGVPNSELRRP